jgi:dephospho-CoA kinase
VLARSRSDTMRILVTTGMPGAGKEEFLLVCQARGAKVVRMGDIVRDKVRELGLDPSDNSVGTLANDERKRYGMDIWAKRTIQFVGGDFVLIDGARGLDEVRAFKRAFGEDLMVVAIHSSPKTRYGRIKVRSRGDSPTTWDQFEERDRRELAWGLGGVIATADYMIVNEGTLDELKAEVARLLDRLLAKR